MDWFENGHNWSGRCFQQPNFLNLLQWISSKHFQPFNATDRTHRDHCGLSFKSRRGIYLLEMIFTLVTNLFRILACTTRSHHVSPYRQVLYSLRAKPFPLYSSCYSWDMLSNRRITHKRSSQKIKESYSHLTFALCRGTPEILRQLQKTAFLHIKHLSPQKYKPNSVQSEF